MMGGTFFDGIRHLVRAFPFVGLDPISLSYVHLFMRRQGRGGYKAIFLVTGHPEIRVREEL